MSRKRFTFAVLCYNHQEYIVEHLESIKYLIDSYGDDWEVDLVVNDDASTDNTVRYLSYWLNENFSIFNNVKKIFNSSNSGTCASVLNILENVDTTRLKITAGDDVYSYENIFEHSSLSDNVSFSSGIPLILTENFINESIKTSLEVISSHHIYRGKKLIDRFIFLSNNNAPNMFYNFKNLTDPDTISFLKDYDVVEDWPLQVAIAEKNPDSIFTLSNKVFVYYRRTSGSSYITAEGRFFNDKVKVYNYLIERSDNFFSRFVLENRLWLFRKKNKFLNVFFNIAFYRFVFGFFLKIVTIFRSYSSFKKELLLVSHKEHYSLLKNRADYFMEDKS
ncbi:glycosyltransferase family 2 protein [Marinomonas sp. M1K-6]|uniref:Glycosyltransferase family 2 protein n=1 Tax=Marinomonas profundi TaxID=2726122 RepID=A0A847R4Q3_9GAMM|nr:glycosyltransferase family 2 protein [Marinomonas profundi]NLQ18981.1 glycosyltransferase family 2 protein [Marinomonas profundi]UDV04187.1 glycosyltransferase family 2 protein [Marinomonas profundi]